MKEIYIDIMERALHAYDKRRMLDYIADVKKNGLTEHGFARLAADLAILDAFGRCTEYRDIMLEMMEMCCERMPQKRAANEFSVREIVCALNLCRETETVDKTHIKKWVKLLSSFDPYTKYDVVTAPFESKGNWAAFGAVSEIVRSKLCGIDSSVFIDNQISSLLNDFDENGMYKDPHNPMVYDYVTRVLLDYMLYAGYNGKYRDRLKDYLIKAAPFSIQLQSATGEMPFGGRSNQFFHNQMWIAADYEFLAHFFATRGETEKECIYGSELPLEFVRETTNSPEISATFSQELAGEKATIRYALTPDGVRITGYGAVTGFMLPVFEYDGETFTDIAEKVGEITVSYKKHFCRYTFDAPLDKGYERYYNRNGRYRVYKIPSNSIKINLGKD